MRRVLCVGDGDLSFSGALARAYGGADVLVVGAVLEPSLAALRKAHPRASPPEGVAVVYGVDAASSLAAALELAGRFDAAVFNLPHLGDAALAADHEGHAAHNARHRCLLAHFAAVAREALVPGTGVASLALVGRQPERWEVHESFERLGFVALEGGGSGVGVPGLEGVKLTEARPEWSATKRWADGEAHWAARYGYAPARHRTDAKMRVAGVRSLAFRAPPAGGWPALEEEPLTCAVCRIAFASEDALATHVARLATPDPPATCETCGRRFASEYALRMHLGSGAHEQARSKRETVLETEEEEPDDDGPPETVRQEVVGADAAGARLVKWVRAGPLGAAGGSKAAWKRALAAGGVTVNGARAEETRLLRAGDVVALTSRAERLLRVPVAAHAEEIRVLHAAGDLVVVWKPTGMRCRGAHAGTLESTLKEQLGLGELPTSLSRIEIGCPGVCAVALRSAGAVACANKLEHTFRAIVRGRPEPDALAGTARLTVLRVAGDVGEVELETPGGHCGRCCGTLCAALREAGHAVVGDRFARGESRAAGGGMLGRLQMACTRVRGAGLDVAADPPTRFAAVLRAAEKHRPVELDLEVGDGESS